MQSESIKTRQKHRATVLEQHLSKHIISVYPLCLKNVSQIESVFVKSSSENWLQTVLLLLWFQQGSPHLPKTAFYVAFYLVIPLREKSQNA